MPYKNIKKQQYSKEYYQKNKEKLIKYARDWKRKNKKKHNEQRRNSIYEKYFNYKSSAKKRHYNWGLTFKQFQTFWQKPCYYCGNRIKTIGLDRTDNSKGYNLDNLVSCCRRCNRMKMILTKQEFINQCIKISKKHS